MTPEQAESFRYSVLDLTKVWPHKDYPLRKIGKFVLNENVQNYFAEVEQVGSLLLSARRLGLSETQHRLLSLPPIPSPTLSHLATLSCSLASSPTLTPTATALASTTLRSLLTSPLFRLPTSSATASWPSTTRALALTTRALSSR